MWLEGERWVGLSLEAKRQYLEQGPHAEEKFRGPGTGNENALWEKKCQNTAARCRGERHRKRSEEWQGQRAL